MTKGDGMSEKYTLVNASNHEATLKLPGARNNVNIFHVEKENKKSIPLWEVKSGFEKIKVVDSKGKLVSYIMPNEVKTVKAVKPKWYQIIKRIKGEYRWVIV